MTWPGTRGRLIFPTGVKLAQLDAEATAAQLGGKGYDDVFREPGLVPSAGGGPGTSTRQEATTAILRCQVEIAKWDERRQAFTGNLPQGSLILVFHFADLEENGMVDANGSATIRVGDRIEGFYNLEDASLIERPRTPLYAVEPEPNSFGLTGLRRNLLLVAFAPRDAGLAT